MRGGAGRAMVAAMNRVRTIDFGAFDRTRYDTQFLYQGESCVVIGSHVPSGLSAYGRVAKISAGQGFVRIAGFAGGGLGGLGLIQRGLKLGTEAADKGLQLAGGLGQIFLG